MWLKRSGWKELPGNGWKWTNVLHGGAPCNSDAVFVKFSTSENLVGLEGCPEWELCYVAADQVTIDDYAGDEYDDDDDVSSETGMPGRPGRPGRPWTTGRLGMTGSPTGRCWLNEPAHPLRWDIVTSARSSWCYDGPLLVRSTQHQHHPTMS